MSQAQGNQQQIPEELAQCGIAVEKLAEELYKENHNPISIASALLGGALGLLARTLDADTILKILDSAAASVRSGDLHRSVQVAQQTPGA
ncbi:hypothetical protein LOC54_04905 [Acetobacter sp. AN02]|uniref:hypothetical protein n=1 Tax=Acetobacter sp. AN02 TaxID=2894186 RepID=UPI00243427D1|nr:hypothetical protein [Acetobacter sp. AN02]MDG6094457.1 hypothetical protein [Acetobacter sp. AN02]